MMEEGSVHDSPEKKKKIFTLRKGKSKDKFGTQNGSELTSIPNDSSATTFEQIALLLKSDNADLQRKGLSLLSISNFHFSLVDLLSVFLSKKTNSITTKKVSVANSTDVYRSLQLQCLHTIRTISESDTKGINLRSIINSIF